MFSQPATRTVRFYNYALPSARVQERILRGLRQPEKCLPSFLLYDPRGIRLFDRLCAEGTQSSIAREAELLSRCGPEIGRLVGRRLTVIEYGSGTARTAVALLKSLPGVAAYVPVDLSLASLRFGVRRVREGVGNVPIVPVRADFTSCFGMPVVRARADRPLIHFSSCALGTMQRSEASRVLRGAGKFCGQHGGILLSVELPPQGATETLGTDCRTGRLCRAFNLNILAHINRRYSANFHRKQFAHATSDGSGLACRELRLVSRADQTVTIDQEKVRLRRGDRILTQARRRYSWSEIEAIAEESGCTIERTWTTGGNLALCLLWPQA